MADKSQASREKSSAAAREAEKSSGISRLGELLLADGLIDERQLQLALDEQKLEPNYLGVILMRKKWVDERQVYEKLSAQRGVELMDVRDVDIPSEVLDKVPREIALEYSVVPLYLRNGELAVAMEDPFNDEQVSKIRSLLPGQIKPGLATRADLHYAINRLYNNLLRSSPTIRDFYDGFAYLVETKPFDANRAIDLLVALAHLLEASDVHLALVENNSMQLALRVDGVLQRIPIPARRFKPEIISQLRNALKIRSGLDPSKKGVAQDGRLEVQFDELTLLARTALIPALDGEKFALRIIGQLRQRRFEELGLSVYHRKMIAPILKSRGGLILVAGATGAGKTTTLYALLNKISTQDRMVITIEDPVEARLRNTIQVQVDREKQLNFAAALRAILRQDPDIILLGEIRDHDSAVIALESAMTGHLVLSSVHMENAAGVILRLLHMDVEPFALATALNMIIAQRLAPRVCSKCRQPHPKSGEFAKALDLPSDRPLFHGTGCDACYHTGNSGRTALFEVLTINDELRDIITSSPTLTKLMRYIRERGEQSFREDALAKCHQGLLSPETVLSYS